MCIMKIIKSHYLFDNNFDAHIVRHWQRHGGYGGKQARQIPDVNGVCIPLEEMIHKTENTQYNVIWCKWYEK